MKKVQGRLKWEQRKKEREEEDKKYREEQEKYEKERLKSKYQYEIGICEALIKDLQNLKPSENKAED